MLINKRIPIWFILGKVKVELLAILVFLIGIKLLDPNYTGLGIIIPIAAPTILGTTISLLIAFRTSQSYERWWEARAAWGVVVNSSRTLIRQVMSLDTKLEPEFIQDFANRQIAWCYALGLRLRGLDQIATISKYLSAADIEVVKDQQHIPNALLTLHTNQVCKLAKTQGLDSVQQVRIDETIADLTDAMGVCERIKTTVFPKTYSVLIHSLIYLFTAIFPLSLKQYPIFIEISLTVIITIVFFLIENTSTYMQDPFENRATDTPMTTIAQKIENDIREMIGLKPLVREVNRSFYVM